MNRNKDIASIVNSGKYISALTLLNDIGKEISAIQKLENRNNSQSRIFQLSDAFAKTQPLPNAFATVFEFMNHNTSVLQRISSQMTMLEKIQSSPLAQIGKRWKTTLENLDFTGYDLGETDETKDLSSDIIITETNQLKKIIADIYHDNKVLYEISSRKFEEVIAELLSGKGFKVELTKQTRDGGYDILALKSLSGFPLKFLVECKRNSQHRAINVDVIRSFCHVIKKERANQGIIFTTSYFSPDSIKEKEGEGHLLELRDKNDIIYWVNDYLKIK